TRWRSKEVGTNLGVGQCLLMAQHYLVDLPFAVLDIILEFDASTTQSGLVDRRGRLNRHLGHMRPRQLLQFGLELADLLFELFDIPGVFADLLARLPNLTGQSVDGFLKARQLSGG